MNTVRRKAAIVGAGQVGATTAYTLLISGLLTELVLVDLNEKKALGEAIDISHGMPLCPPADIRQGGYEDMAGSDIVILTAGASQKPGETRMDLLRKNVKVFESIVPQVVKYAPDAIIVVVTNPVDPLTYETIRLSGLPASRVIGSGTVLDTSRLRYLLGRHTGIDPRDIHTFVLGEHGDSELAAWSLTTISGMGLDEYCRACGGCDKLLSQVAREEFDGEVRNVAYTIIDLKGATYYAVALAVRRIVEAILRDEKSILTVSSMLTGQYGLNDVCLSLPAIVGMNGIEQALEISLNDDERAKLIKSAGIIRDAIDNDRG